MFQNTIMLSCCLDPDQDLQSGSKLFTWYDVCCNRMGGGGGVLCPSCKIQRGGLCSSCKIHRGDYVLVVKFMGGILSTYTKMSRGGFVPRGFCPTLCHNACNIDHSALFFLTKHAISNG